MSWHTFGNFLPNQRNTAAFLTWYLTWCPGNSVCVWHARIYFTFLKCYLQISTAAKLLSEIHGWKMEVKSKSLDSWKVIKWSTTPLYNLVFGCEMEYPANMQLGNKQKHREGTPHHKHPARVWHHNVIQRQTPQANFRHDVEDDDVDREKF